MADSLQTLPETAMAGASHKADEAAWPEAIALPNGLTFRLRSATMRGAANFLIKEIFTRRRYYRPGFEIRPGDTVIDIGANMGLFALWAAPQASRGMVLAIEPTSVIECLNANVRCNGLTNVKAVKAGVGRDGAQLELVTYPGFNIVSHQANWKPAAMTRFLIRCLYGRYDQTPVRETAPCVSLGKLMDDYGVETANYLKIDCEGGEYEILRNMDDRDWGRIERIAMEFHELEAGQDHRELVSTLKAKGFQVEVRKRLLDYWCMKFGELWAWRG